MKNKIAVAMISKGVGQEVPNLKRCLQSIAPHVDKVFVTLTSPTNMTSDAQRMLKEFDVHITHGDFRLEIGGEIVDWVKEFLKYEPAMKVGSKIFLFDEARNFAFAQVPEEYDWILWIDTDDVFLNADKLRSVAELGQREKIEAFYFDYLYQAVLEELPGLPPEKWRIRNVVIQHLRERMIRNTGKFKWIAPIHETLIEQTPTNKSDNYDCAVLHLATEEDRAASLTRNLPNLEYAIYTTKGKDPRHLYYLAKAYFDMRSPETDQKATPLILEYLYGEHNSGWPQERAQACDYLAEIYRNSGQFNKAIKAALNGLTEDPNDPSLFLSLANTYLRLQDYDKALFWVKIADSIPPPKTTLVKTPRDIEGQKLEIIYNIASNTNRIDEAWAASYKIRELLPSNPFVQETFNNISMLREQRDVSRTIVTLADYLKKRGEYYKIKPLLQAVPAISEQAPAIVDLRNKNMPPKFWGKDEIAIWCGPQFTNWSGKSLLEPNGAFIGGSEEAVIRMSEELVKLGWKVTVYCDPQEECFVHGVKYVPHFKANILDHFNILISWRNVGLVDNTLKAKKIYIWNHDIQNPLDWTPERISKFTKAIFLSKWHRDNIPKIDEEKVFLSSNGV